MQLAQNLKNYQKLRTNGFVFAFFIVTRLCALLLSFPCITDVGLYLDRATKLQLGLTPYSQFAFEYPPLALIAIYLPGKLLPSNEFAHYFLLFATMMFLLDFYCLKLCQSYCKNQLSMNDEQISWMTLLYSLFGLLLFRILYHRLDLVVALFFTISLIFFQVRDSRLSAKFFLNSLLGFFYKIIPAITLPPAIILKAFNGDLTNKKIIGKICLNSIVFAAAISAIIGALEIYTDHNFVKNMLFHQERGIQIESSFGSFLLFKNMLLSQYSSIITNYGSWNISTDFWLEKTAKFAGSVILFFFYGALFFVLLSKKKAGEKIKISEENFLDATLVTILLFLAFQRVLSTQFFIWLIPISAIWLAKNRSPKFLLIFSFLFFATFMIFSIDYFALVCEEKILVTVLFLRNLVLLATSCFMAIRFLKKLS